MKTSVLLIVYREKDHLAPEPKVSICEYLLAPSPQGVEWVEIWRCSILRLCIPNKATGATHSTSPLKAEMMF